MLLLYISQCRTAPNVHRLYALTYMCTVRRINYNSLLNKFYRVVKNNYNITDINCI